MIAQAAMVEREARRTVSSDGVELACVEAGARDRPTIVFVHGYPDSKELWGPLLARLAPHYHVVAYDVRGAGESSAPRGPRPYDLARLADDFRAVAQAVAPGRGVHLVGHDWGGIQGWEFATRGELDGTLRSFTSIAGPSLDQLALAGRELLRRPTPRSLLELAARARRSWYVALLLTPGLPTVAWRWVLAGGRWRRYLSALERLPPEPDHPPRTLAANGCRGANLYRRNVPRRLLRPRRDAVARVPVQLIVPTRDHFISSGYYELAERFAPELVRRTVNATHWAPRAQPELIARWVSEFVEAVEAGGAPELPRPWVRRGGLEQLAGRLALVTGAGSGIGRATALALAGRGARVLVVDRDPDSLERTAAEIACPKAHTFVCDVSDGRAMQDLADRVVAEHGVPDVVVNNAGIGVAGPFVETDVADLERIVAVNLMGVAYGCRLFGRAMVHRGCGGQIVNTASMAAFTPAKDLGAYAATKAAVLMLSESLRAELAPHGIGVTAVCPGFIATNITRATRYVGLAPSQQRRRAERVTRLYQQRNFPPERVAEEILTAIGEDRPLAVITPEAKIARALSRVAPRVLRRLAKVDMLPT